MQRNNKKMICKCISIESFKPSFKIICRPVVSLTEKWTIIYGHNALYVSIGMNSCTFRSGICMAWAEINRHMIVTVKYDQFPFVEMFISSCYLPFIKWTYEGGRKRIRYFIFREREKKKHANLLHTKRCYERVLWAAISTSLTMLRRAMDNKNDKALCITKCSFFSLLPCQLVHFEYNLSSIIKRRGG